MLFSDVVDFTEQERESFFVWISMMTFFDSLVSLLKETVNLEQESLLHSAELEQLRASSTNMHEVKPKRRTESRESLMNDLVLVDFMMNTLVQMHWLVNLFYLQILS